MDEKELIKELKKLIIEKLRLEYVKLEDINENDELFGGPLGLDSVDALELAMHIEQIYKIKISDEVLAKEAFKSVKALANFILREKKCQA